MKRWFLSQSQRDQLALLILVLVLGVGLIYRLALLPASQQRAQMADNNRSAALLLGRVDAKVTELIALRADQAGTDNSSLTAVVSRTAQAAGLPISRLQPNSRGEVQVRFERVEFDALLTWIMQAEQDLQLTVIDASITQAGRAGGVNATLRLAGGT